MPTPFLPYQRDPIAGNLTTPNNWYEFFRALRQFVEETGIEADSIPQIIERLEELESNALTDFLIQGLISVQVSGTPEYGQVNVQLVNDELEPSDGGYATQTYFYGQDFTGTKGWNELSADNVTVASLPGASYFTLQKALDVLMSPGIITGGELTVLTSTSVRISAGTAVVRIADDNVSELRFFDFPSQDFNVSDVQVTHFYRLEYNGGSPIITDNSVDDADRDTEIPLGSALRGNGLLNITPNPYRVGDVITNLIQRLDAIGPVQRDNSVGGLQLGETGTRNTTVTAGRLWARVSDFTIPAKNSSVDTMANLYFNGTNLTVTSGITQWDNQNYNDLGTGSLVALGNNKYANLWFFMSFNGDHYGYAYGTAEYNTLGEAANENIPSYLTQNFFNQFVLLGRYVFQESAATATFIESAFVTLFTTQAVNNHNDLGGLQGGTTNEFYHLTAAEYGNLVLTGTGSPEGVVTANVGRLYTRTDGGASTTLYVKESGAGNTGWVAK